VAGVGQLFAEFVDDFAGRCRHLLSPARIKIGDISGKVLETTLLVTRILTPTNVVISIPNSQISTSSIENFSFGYRELNQPFIVRTPVYLGYEVPSQLQENIRDCCAEAGIRIFAPSYEADPTNYGPAAGGELAHRAES
jgi:hypothetical protein